MDNSEIRARVRNVIQETLALKDPIEDDNVSLRVDLGADSIDLASLVLVLEEELPVGIDEIGMEHVDTVQQIIDYVIELAGKGNA